VDFIISYDILWSAPADRGYFTALFSMELAKFEADCEPAVYVESTRKRVYGVEVGTRTYNLAVCVTCILWNL
jgi:hypothetical protein